MDSQDYVIIKSIPASLSRIYQALNNWGIEYEKDELLALLRKETETPNDFELNKHLKMAEYSGEVIAKNCLNFTVQQQGSSSFTIKLPCRLIPKFHYFAPGDWVITKEVFWEGNQVEQWASGYTLRFKTAKKIDKILFGQFTKATADKHLVTRFFFATEQGEEFRIVPFETRMADKKEIKQSQLKNLFK